MKRGELHCPVPGCDAFQSAVGGSRRHHFRHYPWTGEGARPGHDPESKEHFEAKHAIAHWLRDVLGEQLLRLEVDEHQLRTAAGVVVEPDVYAELVSGAKIAVEYQASPGDIETLQHKTKIYTQLGVHAWWLYSPGPKTCPVKDPDRGPGRLSVLLTPQQKTLAGIGSDFYWLDAPAGRIGTPLAVSRLRIPHRAEEIWLTDPPQTGGWYARKPFTVTWSSVGLDDAPLSACSVDVETGSLLTPGTRRIQQDKTSAAREVVLRLSQ